MTPYTTVLFLHLASMAGLFVGYGLEWIVSSLLRRATTADQARAWLRVYRFSLPVSGPALLLLILTGGYLASQMPGGMKAPWISATFVGIVIALGIGFSLILPRVKAIRAALPEGSGALGATALTSLQDAALPTLIRVRAMLALGIVYLMTLKPMTMAGAFVDLGVAILLGVVFALPTWSKAKPAA
ncbi:MAG: hypothetical protein WCE52_14160 [Candidatus Acidiferrum sp.]